VGPLTAPFSLVQSFPPSVDCFTPNPRLRRPEAAEPSADRRRPRSPTTPRVTSASNKAKTITRGTTTIAFQHDAEGQRYAQVGPNGVTLYISGMGVLAERFGQLGGPQRWTNLPVVGGRLIGIRVENADETTLTRYFHTDHLGSIAVISDEAGQVGVGGRLSYDAWGLRRQADGCRLRPGGLSVAPCSRRSRTSAFGVALRAILAPAFAGGRCARRITRCHRNDAAEWSEAAVSFRGQTLRV
jgi:hypothetical protein